MKLGLTLVPYDVDTQCNRVLIRLMQDENGVQTGIFHILHPSAQHIFFTALRQVVVSEPGPKVMKVNSSWSQSWRLHILSALISVIGSGPNKRHAGGLGAKR